MYVRTACGVRVVFLGGAWSSWHLQIPSLHPTVWAVCSLPFFLVVSERTTRSVCMWRPSCFSPKHGGGAVGLVNSPVCFDYNNKKPHSIMGLCPLRIIWCTFPSLRERRVRRMPPAERSALYKLRLTIRMNTSTRKRLLFVIISYTRNWYFIR